VSYDHLVVAVGADVNTFNIPGIHEHAVFMKELEDGMKLQRKLHDQLEKASAMLAAGASKEEVAKLLHFVVVGGGPTGVELTAELGDFLRDDVEKAFPAVSGLSKVTLVEAGPKILATFDPHISEYAKGRLEAHGASVQTGTMVRRATESSLLVAKKGEPDASIDYGVLVWAGGVKARGFTEKMARKIGGVQTPANRPIR
jgi:NADH:ubiquinone reductase (non-electrogenic)